jgi:hypothetical protein
MNLTNLLFEFLISYQNVTNFNEKLIREGLNSILDSAYISLSMFLELVKPILCIFPPAELLPYFVVSVIITSLICSIIVHYHFKYINMMQNDNDDDDFDDDYDFDDDDDVYRPINTKHIPVPPKKDNPNIYYPDYVQGQERQLKNWNPEAYNPTHEDIILRERCSDEIYHETFNPNRTIQPNSHPHLLRDWNKEIEVPFWYKQFIQDLLKKAYNDANLNDNLTEDDYYTTNFTEDVVEEEKDIDEILDDIIEEQKLDATPIKWYKNPILYTTNGLKDAEEAEFLEEEKERYNFADMQDTETDQDGLHINHERLNEFEIEDLECLEKDGHTGPDGALNTGGWIQDKLDDLEEYGELSKVETEVRDILTSEMPSDEGEDFSFETDEFEKWVNEELPHKLGDIDDKTYEELYPDNRTEIDVFYDPLPAQDEDLEAKEKQEEEELVQLRKQLVDDLQIQKKELQELNQSIKEIIKLSKDLEIDNNDSEL